MSQVIFFNDSMPAIGLHTRNATIGNEFEMVNQFIDYYCSKFIRENKKNQLAVFVEPRIESGFPDVVFASYLPSILDNWSAEREQLEVCDLKVLSFLCYAQNPSGSKIITKLGLPEKRTITSLEKLMRAKLISYHKDGWKVRNIRDVFSITKLVAVEAKINNVNKVVDQSMRNTWFASHSYALTNASNPINETVRVFTKYGLGLYCKGKQFKKIIEARQYALPSSYQSFQFNEWIGRRLATTGGN